MRMRLGLLHDAEAQQRMHEREQRAAEERKRKAEAPTVRTEVEQKKHDEQKAREAQGGDGGEAKKEEKKRVKIRPLSDARAIELGANFFSEAFIFSVAVGLLLFENFRRGSKESDRRDDVAERLENLEAQVERLSSQHHLPELEALNEKIKRAKEVRARTAWYNPAGWFRSSDGLDRDDEDEGIPGEVEASGGIGGSPKPASKESTVKSKDATDVTRKDGKEAKPPETMPERKAEHVDTVTAATKGR